MDAINDQSCVEIQTHLSLLLYGPHREKTCLQGFANNKGADPACASAQSDRRLCYSLFGKFHM